MRTRVAILVVFLSVALSPWSAAARAESYMEFDSNDPAQRAATEKARGTLAQFWAAFAAPQPGDDMFALLVRIPFGDKQDGEHLWLEKIERDGETISGTIGTAPKYVTHLKTGQRLMFREADISDWMFIRKRQIHGNQTLRMQLKHLPKAQADDWRSRLAKP